MFGYILDRKQSFLDYKKISNLHGRHNRFFLEDFGHFSKKVTP